MFQEEKTFNVRFTLEAAFPEDYEGEEDDYAWLHDWEARVKPEVIVFHLTCLRQRPRSASRHSDCGMRDSRALPSHGQCVQTGGHIPDRRTRRSAWFPSPLTLYYKRAGRPVAMAREDQD